MSTYGMSLPCLSSVYIKQASLSVPSGREMVKQTSGAFSIMGETQAWIEEQKKQRVKLWEGNQGMRHYGTARRLPYVLVFKVLGLSVSFCRQ